MQKVKNIIPGFRLSMGVSIFYISFMILLPLISLVIAASNITWQSFLNIVLDARVLAAYRVSFSCALIAAVINCLFGTILAWVFVRYNFPGKDILDGLIELPFAIPTAVAGISLACLYAPNGLIGQALAIFPVQIAYSQFGIVIALVFVTIPFVVRTVQPVLKNIDPIFEEAAYTLGADKFTIFRRIILPELLPAILLGGGLAFARALGEYGSVIFIAGNMPFKSEIVPLLIMIKLQQFNYTQAASISLVMLVFSFFLMFTVNLLQVHQQKLLQGAK